jgi:nucleotide-binding universal stress UspA family protein
MMELTQQLLVYSPDYELDAPVRAYAEYLRDLLGGQICYEPLTAHPDAEHIRLAAANCDLIIFGEPEQSWLDMLLFGRCCSQALAQSPTSFLLARRPRWPIHRILLILRFEETDQAAIEWLVRLAQRCAASVTLLPIVPSLPAMYSLGNQIYAGPDVLLSSNTATGQQLRQVAHQLNQNLIEGELRLRQGEPDWQIRDEVIEGNYDLILIGEEPHGRVFRLLMGEIVSHLLSWVERPLLIAKPHPKSPENGNG